MCINSCHEGLLYQEDDVAAQVIVTRKARRCLSNCGEIGKYLAANGSMCVDECTYKIVNATIN